MADEENVVSGDVATETETTETTEQITNVGDVNEENKTISVDMWGVSVDLPLDKAKALIEKRDSRSKVFNEINTKVKEYETKLTEATRKAQALEAARNGAVAEAEALFNQKLDEKLNKFKSKVVDGELKSALTSHPEFLNSEETIQDALSLIKAQNALDLDDDNNITAAGKDIKTIVNEFISSRPAFKKVGKGNTNSARPAAINAPRSKPTLSQGLEKFLNK